MDGQQTYNPNSFGIKKKVEWKWYGAMVALIVIATMVKLLTGGQVAVYIETALMVVVGVLIVYVLVLRKK